MKQKNEKSQNYHIEHSYVDMRYHILGKKLYHFWKSEENLKKKILNEIEYTQYNISDEVVKLYDQNDETFDKLEILKLIIEYQSKQTTAFVKFQIYVYIFGFYIPLMIQLEEQDPSLILYCCISSLLTSLFLFRIEWYQMRN